MADAMADRGIDWSISLKPFLSHSLTSLNKIELLELCSTITKAETEILRPKANNKTFLNSFVILAADYISKRTQNLSVSQLEIVTAACQVLLKYFLNALESLCAETVNNATLIERYLNAIQILCTGSDLLSSSEVSSLLNAMKGETVPPINNPVQDSEKDNSNKAENNKNRSDLSSSIFEQLTLPLRDDHTVTLDALTSKQPNPSEASTSTDASSEINKLFLKMNLENLQILRAGDTLVDLCLNLASIKKAKGKVDDALAGKPFSLPSNHSEATALRNGLATTLSEINLATSAISLPVLEPLTSTKLDKLIHLGMAILHVAVCHAAANSLLGQSAAAVSPKCPAQAKEDDADATAVNLIEQILHLHTFIGTTIKNSTRAGGHVYQNHVLAGAWVLVSGLQAYVNAGVNAQDKPLCSKDDRWRSQGGSASRDPSSARLGPVKFQQSFGILMVALCTKTLSLLSELFDDLNVEAGGEPFQVDPAPLAAMGHFTALQRVARILNAAPLNQLFFYWAMASYRKACTLKRLRPSEGDTFSQSDSTTYYEDMILCSEESDIISSSSTDEDDDSEPIFGLWFEKTLTPAEPSEPKTPLANTENTENKQTQAQRNRAVVPEKGEPYGYISLAKSTFVFLNKHFLSSKSAYVKSYVRAGLYEQQMIILAVIIRDLDKETSKTEVGTISLVFGPQLGRLYCEFSGALMRFTHNLIALNNFNSLQTCLLNHLGVSPWNSEPWPLQVYSRTLSVLTQVLLLRPQNEKEASVISIWHRLVNTLIENVLNSPTGATETDNEDLNVEHAQVLLYLFHTLNLMQKKSVVLSLAGGILRCSEVARGALRDSQLLHLSRLLLLFDYIMKHLYDAPASLLEQIQWNFFYSTNLNTDGTKENNMTRMYSPWQEIEDNYRKAVTSDEFSMKPRFYTLATFESNNQDLPKLDGLACNFILGTPDKLRYTLLLDALMEILSITHVVTGNGSAKMSILGLCASQYCFTICWRLLQLLPPSVVFMEKLVTLESKPPGPLLLNALIWGPRTAHKNFSRWLKDCLIKQGMYTQHADKLVKTVDFVANNLVSDAKIAKNCMLLLTPDVKQGFLKKESFPPIFSLMLLDVLLAKVQVSVQEPENNADGSQANSYLLLEVRQDLLPHVIKLTQSILQCTRWYILHSVAEQNKNTSKVSLESLICLQDILAIASSENSLTNSLATELNPLLPSNVISVQQEWTKLSPQYLAPVSYQSDIIPSENYLLKIVDIHISSLSKPPFNINLSLKRLMQSCVNFICECAPKIENTDTKNKAIETLVACTLDLQTEFLYERVSQTLDKLIGDSETDEHQKRIYLQVLHHTYKLITEYTMDESTSHEHVNEKILHHCLKFYEKIIEKSSGRQALETFFTGDKDLVKVLLSVANVKMSQQYSTRVLHFFYKMFEAAEKSSTDPSLNYLCGSMSKLAEVNEDKLQAWLKQVIIGSNMDESSGKMKSVDVSDDSKSNTKSSKGSASPNAQITPSEDMKSIVQENSQLLQALTSFIVKKSSNITEDAAITILKALVPLGSYILSPILEGVGFTDLMIVMTMLADGSSGKGHIHLFPITFEWITLLHKYFIDKNIIEKLTTDPDYIKNNTMVDSACCILEYVSEVVVNVASSKSNLRPLSPAWDSGETNPDLDSDCQEENEDDESGVDSDEDSLCNKLCTFTITQKEFMNQHWYHCHTCRMLDGVGVCSVCARVCHKGHDLSYAKYGNFFCDCGAKEDGSCQALTKRNPLIGGESESKQLSQNNLEKISNEMLRQNFVKKQTASPVSIDRLSLKKKWSNNVQHLEGSLEWIINFLGNTSTVEILIDFIKLLIPAVENVCKTNSPVGCHARALSALDRLHNETKQYHHTDQLMTPTLGSQEGAFENVRISYSGEQGQTIRQLLSAHILRRVAMCCMSSPYGRRQHLAVSHEKGKITVLQLSALLKQADSATRKLTLTRLSSAPVSFTVISMASNLCNDDFLAVCGLKDCHILTFSPTGTVTDHLVLQPQLETGNFIIKALWLPGSQTRLALITADFVKIYDLSVDALSPQYYFLVPSGKIRDCTFVYADGIYQILLMSSPGHIYSEFLNEESSAKHGTFYVTNTLEVFHLDVTDVNGQIAGGGVSIYYSHKLGLLFYSYMQGKSFISPHSQKNNCLTVVFPITLSASSNNNSSKSNGSRNNGPQPLCQWTEIPNHPGLICCSTQSSNSPVVLMLKPDTILIQEIRVVPSKSKIMDMVAIRHSSTDPRTTLMLLCEDGSLKMFIANMEQTGFWMTPSIQSSINLTPPKQKKKKIAKTKTSHSTTFPVDFFEHCQPMNDTEIGGNDLLQVYNSAQLKHRLNTMNLYVACNKPVGFTINVTNNDSNMVMTGLRVLVGSQEIQRAPSFIEVFGRIIPLTVTRSRWFDIPFSREESLCSDKTLTIMFGPSQDPENITMVDSIKIFGRSKDGFGWPEESEEVSNSSSNQQSNFSTTEAGFGSNNLLPTSALERVVVGILEALDGTFMLHLNDEKFSSFKQTALQVATSLLILPASPAIQINSKALLSSLHLNKSQYHSYKDQALLQHVVATLNAMTDEFAKDPSAIDAESYYRLVLIVKNVAISRPQNLVKFADSHTSIQDVILDDPLEVKPPRIKDPKKQHLLLQLMDVLWTLHSVNPEIPPLSSVIVPGLKHTEQIIHGLVEIVHAFNSCDTYSNITIAVYMQLLLCKDSVIAFGAKQALTQVLKPGKKKKGYTITPPRCPTPMRTKQRPPPFRTNFSNQNEEASQSVESIAVLQQPNVPMDENNQDINPLEALFGGAAGFQPLIEIPPDADDEAMVELAIALSLQDHDMAGEAQLPDMQAISNDIQALAQQVQNIQRLNEAGHFSDTTASGVGSDDEGSTAATDGSTLRTSPADQGGSAGSESGGSGVDSITGEHNVSDRSSAYGDNNTEGIVVSKATTSTAPEPSYQNIENEQITQTQESDIDPESNSRLHILRLQLLERLIEYLPKLKDVGGTRSVPFLQVVLLLTSELNCANDRDKACLHSLVGAIVHEIHLGSDCDNFTVRDHQKEVQLVLMRLLSVLMSRCKSSQSGSSKCVPGDSLHYISQRTAAVLHKSNIVTYCGKIVQSLVDYWKNYEGDVSQTPTQGALLKEHLPYSPPDMTPFFMKQFVKEHYMDIFSNYPHLVTDMALRLPYQIYKHYEISDPITSIFNNNWYRNLCEYMMVTQAPLVRRQVRKLLLFICGSKEKYRQLRDYHTLTTHVKGIKQCCFKGGYQPPNASHYKLSLSYDALVELVEHLKACLEVAVSRTGNWQRFCVRNNDILPYLLQVSVVLDDSVASTALHLVQCAIVMAVANRRGNDPSKNLANVRKEKSDEYGNEAMFDESNCVVLVEQLHKHLTVDNMMRFIKTFTLESNVTHVRWQAHSLILSIYRNSKPHQQETILKLLWQLWKLLPLYGKKAIQFVDLLGHFSLEFVKTEEGRSYAADYVNRVVSVFKIQNRSLARHPNANLYGHLAQYVELDGYYLESDPCLVCNNPEIPFSTIKLNTIKVDSKFTTTTQIVKLLGSYTISRITIKIGDLKRTKMVRTINIYYNNRSVQAVVELKNKPLLWHKAKSVVLSSGQTEVKIEFALPIIACNFMIEYADFYENLQASTETLQCPRCSAAVPANPGVCGTCGENVFQCHKCRAINYDEKDPFLCHSCGFCKYAKFDFTLLAKPCFAVETIENDEDLKKMVSSINTLIDKADRVYKQLLTNKPTLENLLSKVTDQKGDKRNDEVFLNNSGNTQTSSVPVPAGTAQIKVNRAIQALAQQYCNDCKSSFEELSKNLQKILVSRKELIAYDRKNTFMDTPKHNDAEKLNLQSDPCHNSDAITTKCYGCCSATIEHCLTLLRALTINPITKNMLSTRELIQELVCNNLRKGSPQMQEEVRQLLSVLTTDNVEASEELCALLEQKFVTALGSNMNSVEFRSSIKHEIELLASLVQKEDSTWEMKLKCMFKLFVRASKDEEDPIIMESVILPCLKIFHSLMKPPETGSKKNKDKANNASKQVSSNVPVDATLWLEGKDGHSFSAWQKRLAAEKVENQPLPPNLTAKEVKEYYLQERYFKKWKNNIRRKKNPTLFIKYLCAKPWLKTVLFSPVSRLARQMMCSILKLICNNLEGKKQVLVLLTCFLPELGKAGESSAEFLTLYHVLIQEPPWKQYLTVQGLLITLANLIKTQINKLLKLEETTLTSDLSEGYAINQLTDLMSTLLEDSAIRRQYKRRLVGDVLNGYLCLKRLVVQRTRLIDVTQEKLLELLEEMTTGTQKETKAFMAVCIKTVENCSLQDILTPVFIFERLCSIIYPEESDITEFFLTLEKDPQQEDFLQGRMLGNPYSCLEAGMGPLMRDVKNKICQDCELVALLEDDNGMELLVNNKIISLDLAVRDVYKKIWLEEGGDHDAMRVVYRMRGLLGDATEEFIETLDNKAKGTVNNEEVYKMANELAKENGLKVMVKRLGAIQNVTQARPLVQVLLKLFRLSIKVSKCQEVLIQPEIGAMEVFLRTLKLYLEVEASDSGHNEIIEQLVEIMQTILSKATSKPLETFMEFSKTFGGPEYVKLLIAFTMHPSIKNNQTVMVNLVQILAALVYGDREKMVILIDHFQSIFDFYEFDFSHTPEKHEKLKMFCDLCNGIEKKAIGNTLKDYILELGIVKKALEYITLHMPFVAPNLVRVDSDELKEFISKPALKYILKFLTGMAHSHENTQLAIAATIDTIPTVHRLEQVSSDEHVGSLAENLLEALCTNPSVAKQIERVRELTRSEKKRLAMAMREKQLGQLGMRTNDRGQVTAKSAILQQIEMELGEESGLVCCICREGYKYQPTKVLGIYTFTKRCNVEPFEAKPRKTVGYSTVTHFNIVHIDCHMSAIRLARARDEWESAALQNANTKCNGLLPLWGPQVPESAFASSLARHNTYLQESTSHRDIGHVSTVHDLKLLLLRFAQEKSFHEDSGGGGPESNMHMIPYLIHVALYVINTTRVAKREAAGLRAYLESTANLERCVESAYECEGPFYWMTMSVMLNGPDEWKEDRIDHLRRLMLIAHVRSCQPTGPCKTITQKNVKEWAVYKPYAMFFALIDGIYKYMFKNVPSCTNEQWPSTLADYIRHNDEALLKSSDKLLEMYTEHFLPCESFEEFWDVGDLMYDMTEHFLADILGEFS